MKDISKLISHIIINPYDDLALVESIHTYLAESANPSFFNSWLWVSTWLSTLPKSVSLKFIAHSIDGDFVCCYFLGMRTFSKLKLIKKEKAYLNSTGHIKYDDLVVEYNNVLITPKYQDNALQFIKSVVNVDDIVLPVSTMTIDSDERYFCERIEHPSHWIDLSLIRQENKPYLDYVSKNKRSQIKRSIKEYGGVRLKSARTKDEALLMFEDLILLHQKEWISRGGSGAFSNQFLYDFHHKLITDGFERGNIQLIKVFSENDTVGYLYNFVFNNEVLFYQCGFNYRDGNNFRPGIVTHFKAIEHNLSIGMSKYNFLAGKSQYKKSLSTNSDLMMTYTVTRKTVKSQIEKQIKGMYFRE